MTKLQHLQSVKLIGKATATTHSKLTEKALFKWR